MKIFQASSDLDIQTAHSLFEEYEASLGISLCFQNFAEELAKLPGEYASPDGRLLLVSEDDVVGGCIALRKIDDATCEMKRLYIRPAFRGRGLGRKMVQAILNEAKEIGYTRIRLDTMPGRMDDAIGLYRSFGFKEISPYYSTPIDDTLFMELRLVPK